MVPALALRVLHHPCGFPLLAHTSVNNAPLLHVLIGIAISSRTSPPNPWPVSISLRIVKSFSFSNPPQWLSLRFLPSSWNQVRSMAFLLLSRQPALHQHSWFKGAKHPLLAPNVYFVGPPQGGRTWKALLAEFLSSKFLLCFRTPQFSLWHQPFILATGKPSLKGKQR